ncbi:thiamine pyrophosphate-requiring protein [Acidianus brierleyi]|uniref:2-oxoacid oxidoreductase (ferredoxin) n=1 Tax=Acidianus brierleyi TaxID=41673 RepID=A0A2U9ICT3_9CREN|nr:thiamine pyrophosphate-requiring protein [Acidianus brierleyi]AWR93794.1 thiamine pyrophosphate-requiring protein [Acidianus brierleyi]
MNTAELILEAISKYTDKVFIVSGTDYPAFIKAELKIKNPEFVVIPHEITAASAAIGYSLGNKLGVLMVHTVPGTLNALGIIANAYTSRIPLLVIAGKSPYTDKGNLASRDLRIHWTQDADQEEIVRKYVKWEFEIRDPSQVSSSISRAIQIALSEPQGPVYIAIPREVSIADVNNKKVNMDPFYPGIPDYYLEKAKEMILRASNPVILTWRAGRKEPWFNSLRNFADNAEIPVVNYVGERVNYPSSGKMAIDHYNLKDSDLIIEVETEVPWIPKYTDVDAKIIKVDVDPSYSYIPYYEFPCDLCIQSSVDEFFNKLKIQRKAEKDLLEEIEKQKEEKIERIKKLSDLKEIHPDYLSYEIGKIKWSVFNEYDLNQKYGGFDEFNSYFGDPAMGHLGWALGASVGYKMSTGKDVIATVGDGSFIFGVPTAFYYISKKYPILTVIFDNKSWNAVEKAVKEVYPEEKFSSYPGSDIDIDNLPKTIESIGGFYEYIERPSEVEDALRKGKEKVKSGIPSIIHAKVIKE